MQFDPAMFHVGMTRKKLTLACSKLNSTELEVVLGIEHEREERARSTCVHHLNLRVQAEKNKEARAAGGTAVRRRRKRPRLRRESDLQLPDFLQQV